MKKKIVTLMLAAAMVFSAGPGTASNISTVYAAEVSSAQVEAADATTIDIFTVGTISSANTEKERGWFEFIPDHNALINIVDVAKYGKWELFKKENNNWVSMGQQNYNDVYKGVTYRLSAYSYLAIQSYYEPEDYIYSLSIGEYNDVSGAVEDATKVNLGDTISGTVYSKNDTDWYKINTGKNNLIRINDLAYGGWDSVRIYKNTSDLDNAIIGKCDKGTSDWFRVDKNSTYYIKIADSFSYMSIKPFEYSFSVNGTSDAGDTEKTAEKIKIGKVYTKSCIDDKDKDVYAFKATKNGTVKIAGCISEKGALYYGSVPAKLGMSVKQKGSVSILSNIKELDENFSTSFKVKKGKTYYVIMTPENTWSTYQFKVKYGK